MAEDKFRVGLLFNASLDAGLLDEGRALVGMSRQADSSPVLPALGVILACAALEMAIEGSLKLAQARAKAGGRSVGFLYDVRLGDIEEAFKMSLRWKMENVPSLITDGRIRAAEVIPDVVKTLGELVECRNQLIHGRGKLTEWETEIHLNDPTLDRVSAGGPVRGGRDDPAPNKGFAIQMTFEDGSKAVVPISPPWGLQWLTMTGDQALRFLDCVSMYIDTCIEGAEKGQR